MKHNGLATRVARVLAVASLGTVAACKGGHHFEPPDKEQRVEAAESLYSAQMFDSITWASDSVRALDGNGVYAARCRKCHGPMGQGGTAYAKSRELQVPSLVSPDWRFASSLDSIRHRVFVGHAAGMPNFGVAGITSREIDAVSFYVIDQLRPDVLGGDGKH